MENLLPDWLSHLKIGQIMEYSINSLLTGYILNSSAD